MRPPWEWNESDVLSLINDQVQESLSLDYKACGALAKTDGKKAELTKDVSAFGNSAGGTLVYGVHEKDNLPTTIDVGYDPKEITREWLENVINSGIQRRIDGVRINQVALSSAPGRVLYVVFIPQSLSAPHMAADKRFYRRFNFQSVPMEEYEVRDVGRRSETANLKISMKIAMIQHPVVGISMWIMNDAPEPAHHAIIRIYIDSSVTILLADGMELQPAQTVLVRGEARHMNVLYMQWSVPPKLPIWGGEAQSLTGKIIQLGYPRGLKMRHLFWNISAPKMGLRHGSYGLVEGVNGPELIDFLG
jgi:hypothetical protein